MKALRLHVKPKASPSHLAVQRHCVDNRAVPCVQRVAESRLGHARPRLGRGLGAGLVEGVEVLGADGLIHLVLEDAAAGTAPGLVAHARGRGADAVQPEAAPDSPVRVRAAAAAAGSGTSSGSEPSGQPEES